VRVRGGEGHEGLDTDLREGMTGGSVESSPRPTFRSRWPGSGESGCELPILELSGAF
jgi:hypothetical protein